MTSKEYIDLFKMEKHPEGGYFVETYRSEMKGIFPGFNEERNICTSIYFLLEKGQASSLHRIKSDEIWYYHDGDGIEIIELDNIGKEKITKLGKRLSEGETLQHVVRANTWFGARLSVTADFCLVGCQVSPGFDFRDFELM